MSWEQRGKRTYYYTAQRVGNRIVKRYAGAGIVGEAAAIHDATTRDKIQQVATIANGVRTELAALAASIQNLNVFADAVAAAALVAAGFHRKNRGPWRKRVSKVPQNTSELQASSKTGGWSRSAKEITDLVARAENGDASTLGEIRELLARPSAADALGGDLAHQAIRTLVEKMFGQNLLAKEAVLRKLEQLRTELTQENSTGIEKLLIERIVASWLHLHHLEMCYARQDHQSLLLATYYQKAISMAQKRYLHAIKSLSDVRKLALPVLQVNIAKQQTNIATSKK